MSTDPSELYDPEFYNSQSGNSLSSAEVIVPLFLGHFSPHSVVDIGCGVGGWLRVFQDQGVPDIKGIDGDYVSVDMLHIPSDCFEPADLTSLANIGSFDVACSLEVAEHLPQEAAERFVTLLTSAAPVVLFSAAVPSQGGTWHINEQWQSYWCEKFAERGYVALDLIRPKIWDDERVAIWYRQNVLVFCLPEHVPAGLQPLDSIYTLDRVHPAFWLARTRQQAAMMKRPDSIRSAWSTIVFALGVIGKRLAVRLTAKSSSEDTQSPISRSS